MGKTKFNNYKLKSSTEQLIEQLDSTMGHKEMAKVGGKGSKGRAKEKAKVEENDMEEHFEERKDDGRLLVQVEDLVLEPDLSQGFDMIVKIISFKTIREIPTIKEVIVGDETGMTTFMATGIKAKRITIGSIVRLRNAILGDSYEDGSLMIKLKPSGLIEKLPTSSAEFPVLHELR